MSQGFRKIGMANVSATLPPLIPPAREEIGPSSPLWGELEGGEIVFTPTHYNFAKTSRHYPERGYSFDPKGVRDGEYFLLVQMTHRSKIRVKLRRARKWNQKL